ncbi:MAG: hypothetical protein PG981_000490 [Wolbachia endosymbiont of Ctenocephalides orientis wCori]|nr:MAG: hypothetical protein PG981_000490 [Wolbachia endosymbiont of Ctenocephalides orientis wCori]
MKKQEKLKVISDIYECILTPIVSTSTQEQAQDQAQAQARHCADNNPSKQERVAFFAEQIGTKLQDVKPLNTVAVISSDFKFLNSIQGGFSQDKTSARMR